MTQTEWTVPAVVERIIDGDTISVVMDLGWGLFKKDHVRLAGINAPERNTSEGQASLQWLAQELPVGSKVTLISHSLDKYGRALASIKLDTELGTEDISEALVASGHAVRWDGHGVKP